MKKKSPVTVGTMVVVSCTFCKMRSGKRKRKRKEEEKSRYPNGSSIRLQVDQSQRHKLLQGKLIFNLHIQCFALIVVDDICRKTFNDFTCLCQVCLFEYV